jgi:carbon monoxide dehydrogenase subunit G
MTSTHFDLTSHWRIEAPVEQVWSALTDPAGWPRWWPGVREVQALAEGDRDGLGAVRRLRLAARLPYEVVVEVETVELLRHQRLRVHSRGQLKGQGLWLLHADGTATGLTYVWRVELAARWMRWLAPLLAPLFRWNHQGLMRAGEAGLRRHLGATSDQAPMAAGT